MLEIRSVGFDKDKRKSGILYNQFYSAQRGINIFIINNQKIISKNYDTYAADRTQEIINYLKENLQSNDYKYIVLLTDDDAAYRFNIIEFLSQLPEFGLNKIADLKFRDSYYFIYDNKLKQLIKEEISHISSLHGYYNYQTGNYIAPKKYNLVCLRSIFHFFKEYVDSLKDKLNLNYILLDNLLNYNYSNDQNEIYLFCQSIDFQLITKPINKFLINTEQLTISMYNNTIKRYLSINIPVIDYSLENIASLDHPNIFYLPYQYNENEIEKLKKFYLDTPKIYDVAFCGSVSERRKKILDDIRNLGLTVLEITTDWADTRDMKIASCKMLINIHYRDDYNIYESMRCDRWAFATMPVLSEDSIYDELLDVKKNGVVLFYKYDELPMAVYHFIKNFKQPNPLSIEIIKNERLKILDNFKSIIFS